MEGKNRAQVWNARPVFYASEKECRTMTVPELYDFLQDDFMVPAVFMMRGRSVNLTRKYIQWRVLDSVTYDRKRTKILFFGLQLWRDGGQVTGTAIFDAGEMLNLIETMVNRTRAYVRPYLQQLGEKKKLSEWFVQNFIMEGLVSALWDLMTVDMYLAAYVASFLLAQETFSERLL